MSETPVTASAAEAPRREGISFLSVAPTAEFAQRVFALYRRVYGDAAAFAARWEWEFMQHPRRAEIRLHGAERGGELIAITARHPVRIVSPGRLIPASFASNTMVAPEARGQGIVRELYRRAAASGELQLSKGTAPGMYQVLKKIGYRDILPSTFQVSYLRPLSLALRRLFGGAPPALAPFAAAPGDPLVPVAAIPEGVEALCGAGCLLKDAPYLDWRYLKIPHQRYLLFERREGGGLVSFLVLRTVGSRTYLVDLIWDRQRGDEPATTIRFAREAARRIGASKLIGWSTNSLMREALSKARFRNTAESPRFSYLGNSPTELPVGEIGFVHGDGDLDYL